MKGSGPFLPSILWWGQVLSVDPVLAFAHTNLRKPTKATMEPQVLDPKPKTWRTEHTVTQRYAGKKQKVRALNTVQVSGRVRSEAASFCEWLQQTSKTVNLIPFSWTCRNVLNHIFHCGSITTVAAARVYCPGQFSNNHSSKPTIFFRPQRGKLNHQVI